MKKGGRGGWVMTVVSRASNWSETRKVGSHEMNVRKSNAVAVGVGVVVDEVVVGFVVKVDDDWSLVLVVLLVLLLASLLVWMGKERNVGAVVVAEPLPFGIGAKTPPSSSPPPFAFL